MSIDFDFSEEQRALAATARDLFTAEASAERLRAVWGGAPFDPALWKTFASVGLLGVTVPAEHGGIGGNEIDLALLLEEVGYAALSEPLAEACLAVFSIDDGETLEAIAAGTTIALATDEAFVPDADVATIVFAGGTRTTAFDTARVPSIDHGRRLYRMTGDGEEHDLGPRAPWVRASVLNGVSMRLLNDSVAYAAERRQFGAPIGSFQAIKHALAQDHAALVSARAAAHHAAFTLATNDTRAPVAVSAALVTAIDAHTRINRDALQVHAGIGFTFEHDLHFWLKRGLALAFGASDHRARLAADLLEGTDA